MELIQATANILAFVFNIQLERNTHIIKSLAKDVIPEKFIPKKVKIETDEKKKAETVEVSEED
ncbi:MAG TPA: hypothetical protein PLD02_12815 [Saprospiraceae bacterium]|nr:hypothetical protein [Saprospiraceae bacterium]